MEFDLFEPEACPADHVFNIPRMKGPRREEALACFEVAATQKKAKLIGGRTQVRGLLDCLGEIKILLALETIKHRGRLEGFLLDGVKNISFAAWETSLQGRAGTGMARTNANPAQRIH
jgi:hypothetical protein